MKKMSIEDKFNKANNDFSMFKNKNRVVVGVSGGADSICLLFLIEKFCETNNIKITTAHINHMLRGKESDDDEKFVRDYCKEHNIEFKLKRIDLYALSKEKNMGLEECGRYARYNFFNSLAENESDVIATAHTLSDSVETLLLNIARGSATNGLRGIPPKRGNIIRPLTYVKRDEIIEYLNENSIAYRVDSSNLNNVYNRNKIRNNVIPVLKQINVSFEDACLRLIQKINEDEHYLSEKANIIYEKIKKQSGIDINLLKKQKPSIRNRVIIKIANNKNIESKHISLINRAIENNFGSVQLPGSKTIKIENGIIFVKDKIATHNFNNWSKKFELCNLLTEQKERFIIKLLENKELNKILKNDKSLFKYLVNYDTIYDNTLFRYRKKGDYFKPIGRNITKSYKKLMQEEKISQEKRNSLLMLCNDSEIIWINGLGPSEKAKVDKQTKKAILILPEV